MINPISLAWLINSFDCDEGLPETVFLETMQQIKELYGNEAAAIFSSYIDATDGKFYFKTKEAAEACWEEMTNQHLSSFCKETEA